MNKRLMTHPNLAAFVLVALACFSYRILPGGASELPQPDAASRYEGQLLVSSDLAGRTIIAVVRQPRSNRVLQAFSIGLNPSEEPVHVSYRGTGQITSRRNRLTVATREKTYVFGVRGEDPALTIDDRAEFVPVSALVRYRDLRQLNSRPSLEDWLLDKENAPLKRATFSSTQGGGCQAGGPRSTACSVSGCAPGAPTACSTTCDGNTSYACCNCYTYASCPCITGCYQPWWGCGATSECCPNLQCYDQCQGVWSVCGTTSMCG